MDSNMESRFIDYIDGTLSKEKREEFERELAANPALKADYHAYLKVMEAEQAVHDEHYTAPEDFTDTVMRGIESCGFFERLIMKIILHDIFRIRRPFAYSGIAACAVVLLSFYLTPEQTTGPVEFHRQQRELKETAVTEALKIQNSMTGGGKLTLAAKDEDNRTEAKKTGAIAAQSMAERKKTAYPGTTRRSHGVYKQSMSTESMSTGGGGGTRSAVAGYEKTMDLGKSASRHTCPGCILPYYPPPYPRPYDPNPYYHQPSSTEKYGSYEENPRILTQTEAISTFSIDVDTGSYTNVRRFLRMGQIPPPESVRIEEFINYFKYNYPVQYEKPFTLNYEIAPSPLDNGRYLLKLGIKARDARDISDKGWNLVFLVDVSGSMNSPDKLPLVKQSLKLVVNQMRDRDRIAIVTYAGNAGLVLDSSRIDKRQEILRAIDSLHPGGSTYGSAGINLAYRVAEQNRIPGGVNRIVLATDGDFNVGVTNFSDLIKLIEKKRRTGVTLTTLGFGNGNIKEQTMEQLANKGNGNYFYIDTYQEARKVLEKDLFSNMEVVAKDVKLQIEFNPRHVVEYRLIGYDNRRLRKQDFNNDKIDAGEIGSGHTVTALYELVLAGSELASQVKIGYRYQKAKKENTLKPASEFSDELAFLKIRYKKPDGYKSTLLQYPIKTATLKKTIDEASDDFKFAAAVSAFGHILRESQYRGDYTFDDIIKLAQGAVGEDRDGYRREFVELVQSARSIKGRTGLDNRYRETGGK